ncbi:uncharacterized protein LOC117172392 [Belonocnema kinseyi]|uniref:uncharacterized protein LOC117172392 n=1 Tax=Belonocnema kinseyi TaxID=2817044 RepID=UPI00143DE05B|nr:uncharacterized protein LOC117172392 [Belonocnema kinseyi]
MDWAVICLLALYAFRIVFGNIPPGHVCKPCKARPETKKKFGAAEEKIEQDYFKEVDALKSKGSESKDIKVLRNNCLIDADWGGGNRMEISDNVSDQCDKCYNKGDKDNNIQLANTCCDKAIDKFLKLEAPNVKNAMDCVRKCLKKENQSDDFCKKMLTPMKESVVKNR